jgi:hypothetical protein
MRITFIYAPAGYIAVSKDHPAGGNVVSRMVVLENVPAPLDTVKFGVGF